MSSLKVLVISATNVPNLETFGESDPYTTITYQGKIVTINKTFTLLYCMYDC